jgi:signal transduction histidine kinase
MIYQLVDVLAAVAVVALGLLVYRKSPKSPLNQAFFAVTFLSFWWVVSLSLFYLLDQPVLVNFLGRFNFAVAGAVTPAIFIFAFLFPSRNARQKIPGRKLILTSIVLMAAVTIFTPLVDSLEVIAGEERITHFGPLYPLYVIYFAGFLLAAVVLLLRRYRVAQGLEKTQYTLIFLGTFLATFFGSITNIFIPFLLDNYDFQRLGPVVILFFVATTTYAILRHRFLDVRLAIRSILAKALVAGLWTTVLWLAVLVYNFFLPDPTLNHRLVIFIALTVSFILVAAHGTVYGWVARLTSRFLFQDDYNSGELVRNLSRDMGQSISLPLLKNTIESSLKVAFKPTFVKLLLQNDDGVAPLLIKRLMETRHALVLDELRAADDPADAEIIRGMEDLKAAVILYLSAKDNLLGMLVLGEKLSSDAYSSTDLATLETISYQAGVVLENAYLYQESLDFNQTLKDEVKKATAELQKAYDRLKELDKTKDDFVSVASHELRTPMTIIKNYLWMLTTDRGGQLSAIKKDYVDKANKGVERMLNLVNDMLDVSRIDQGRVELSISDVELSGLLREVVEEFSPQAQGKGVKLELKLPEKRVMVRADEGKLREVVVNLLGNAFKFTAAGGITVAVGRGSATPPGLVCVSVADTGLGISREDQTKLFHKFSRVGNSYTTVAEAGGTGLGLYISRSIIEKMGGQIGVSSQVGQGSTFWFTLPVAGSGSEPIS